MIRANDEIAGFALINTHSHKGGHIERNMGEFFIARRYRRLGVAINAVQTILRLHPGNWEIAVAVRNHAAQVFWPKAIGAAANITNLQRTEGDGTQWHGPIWSFRATPQR